jgi:hypothetical protein
MLGSTFLLQYEFMKVVYSYNVQYKVHIYRLNQDMRKSSKFSHLKLVTIPFLNNEVKTGSVAQVHIEKRFVLS